MNYKEISDFEINGYVAMLRHGFSWIEFMDGYHCSVKCGNDDSPGFAIIDVADYCNNPSDAWPIIMKSKIAVLPWNDNEWQSFVMKDGEPNLRVWHKNPLRAAMIVFLMMNEQ